MTADCDLEQDFYARFSDRRPATVSDVVRRDYSDPPLVPYLLLCDMYEETEIRTRMPPGSAAWRRIGKNQDERYHHFEAAGYGGRRSLPDLYLDFKKTFALPADNVYSGVDSGAVTRVAIVPPIYIHDLMHRFYGFLSRVGLPD